MGYDKNFFPKIYHIVPEFSLNITLKIFKLLKLIDLFNCKLNLNVHLIGLTIMFVIRDNY